MAILVISPQNMANHMVQYLHFRILKFPLILKTTTFFGGKTLVCLVFGLRHLKGVEGRALKRWEIRTHGLMDSWIIDIIDIVVVKLLLLLNHHHHHHLLVGVVVVVVKLLLLLCCGNDHFSRCPCQATPPSWNSPVSWGRRAVSKRAERLLRKSRKSCKNWWFYHRKMVILPL